MASSSQQPPSGTTMLRVVVCPTQWTHPLKGSAPRRIGTHLSAASANRFRAYTDRLNALVVIAPAGWRCAARYFEDGSGGLVVMPPDATGNPTQLPRSFTADSRRGVAALETSACRGCSYDALCPLLSDPSGRKLYGRCPFSRPATELTTYFSKTSVAFADPPGTAGDGAPSGGPAPANGVLINELDKPWPSKTLRGYAMKETCALPAADHALCTTVLNDFLRRYS